MGILPVVVEDEGRVYIVFGVWAGRTGAEEGGGFPFDGSPTLPVTKIGCCRGDAGALLFQKRDTALSSTTCPNGKCRIYTDKLNQDLDHGRARSL